MSCALYLPLIHAETTENRNREDDKAMEEDKNAKEEDDGNLARKDVLETLDDLANAAKALILGDSSGSGGGCGGGAKDKMGDSDDDDEDTNPLAALAELLLSILSSP